MFERRDSDITPELASATGAGETKMAAKEFTFASRGGGVRADAQHHHSVRDGEVLMKYRRIAGNEEL